MRAARDMLERLMLYAPIFSDCDPPAFRAPNGTLLDLFEAFNRRPLAGCSAGPRAAPLCLVGGQAPLDGLDRRQAEARARPRSYCQAWVCFSDSKVRRTSGQDFWELVTLAGFSSSPPAAPGS